MTDQCLDTLPAAERAHYVDLLKSAADQTKDMKDLRKDVTILQGKVANIPALQQQVARLTALMNNYIAQHQAPNQCTQNGCQGVVHVDLVAGACANGHSVARKWNNAANNFVDLSS